MKLPTIAWGKPIYPTTLEVRGAMSVLNEKQRSTRQYVLAKWYGIDFGHRAFFGIQIFNEPYNEVKRNTDELV